MPNGSPALMRAMNAAQVVRELRTQGPLSRADLVRATGLSKPTITNVVAYLESLDYIERATAGPGTSDARSAQVPYYDYRATRGYVLGIDIGADKTLLALADLSGAIVRTERFTTRSAIPLGPPQVLAQLQESTRSILAEAQIEPSRLLAVVAGTPGIVSLEGVVTMAPQLKGWEGLNLRDALKNIYACPVTVVSEVSLSLEAERWVGVAQGINDALFINLGIGVGAGLLMDGQIHRGADGAAGEIGLMPYPTVSADGSVTFAPLESLASGAALQRRGAALAMAPDGAAILALAHGDTSGVDAATVFAAARTGDAAAAALVDEVVVTLAWGIASLVCALNPRTVIIGGGLSRSSDVFIDHLKTRVAEMVPVAPEWFASELGDEAVALGAVNQATAIVERDLFEPLNAREYA